MSFVTPELQFRVEQFLYDEAALLEDGKYRDWLELFTDDCDYWIPVTETRETRAEAEPQRGDLPLMEVGKDRLERWVRRIETGFAFPEEPFSRTRRFVSDVRVQKLSEELLSAKANILVYQSRIERTEAWYVGIREDTLVVDDDSFRVKQRTVRFDQRIMPRAVTLLY